MFVARVSFAHAQFSVAMHSCPGSSERRRGEAPFTGVSLRARHWVVSEQFPISVGHERGLFVASDLKQTAWGPLLRLDPANYWARLLWMDRYNYAGLEDGCEDHEGILGNKLTDPEILRQGLVLRSDWEFAEHLPKKHRQVTDAPQTLL